MKKTAGIHHITASVGHPQENIDFYAGILFELATDEPGFIDDEESIDILGETLALPPAFRNDRERIESFVHPIDTVRSTKVFEKDYLD
ncbi:hypothetical protein [Carnobacterium sp. ISL-102]|jgi:glyoxalase family protein|uniref:hypothetical protein n=1 Tax=Carnobacterium sp. ISL-102 TaxID=2819142 RepID=UPI00333D4823